MPLIIAKLGLSLTLAGTLASLQQLPSLINPLLGLMADRGSLRWLVILAPTTTAIAMSLVGVAPTYIMLCILILVAGVSIALWHTPAPAMMALVQEYSRDHPATANGLYKGPQTDDRGPHEPTETASDREEWTWSTPCILCPFAYNGHMQTNPFKAIPFALRWLTGWPPWLFGERGCSSNKRGPGG